MKRTILKLLCGVLLAAGFVACEDVFTTTRPRGENYERGDDQPGAPGTVETVTLDNILVQYYGEYYAEGAHNFVIKLSSGTYDETGDYFVDKGTEVAIEINIPKEKLFGCTLQCSDDQTNNRCFLAGYADEDDSVFPTYVYVQRSISNDNLDCDLDYVTSGTVALTPNGITMKVEADLTTSGGAHYQYSYSGPYTVVDCTDDDSTGAADGPEGDYEMTGISEVYAYNYGADYDISREDYNDWEIYMYNDSDKEFVCLNIMTAAGVGDKLTPGTYPVTFLQNESDIKAGICVAAYTGENDNVYGTYYGYGEYAWYYADSGSVTISKSGDNFTIDIAFTDEYEEADFTCKYTGPVTCYDMSSVETTATKSGVRFGKKSAKTHRLASSHATVKAPKAAR